MKRLSLLGFVGMLASVLAGCPIFSGNGGDGCVGDYCSSTGTYVGGCTSPADCNQNETCGADGQCHTGDCGPPTGCVAGYTCVVDPTTHTASCTNDGTGGSGTGATGTGGSGAGTTSSTGGAGTGGTGSTGTGGATSSTGAGQVDAGPIVCKSTSSFSTVPKGSCDILQQDCPSGQTCAPRQVGADFQTVCVGLTGLKTAGELCYSDGECDAKLFCIDTKCTPVCCRDNDEPCNGGTCDINVAFGTHNIFVCHFAPKCDLLTPNACPTGLDCHIEDTTQGLATCGSPNGTTGPELSPCMFLNDCGTMQQCFQSDSLCHYYCNPGDTTKAPGLGGCPPYEDCLTKYNGADLGLGVAGLGLCFPNGTAPPDAGSDAPDDAAGDAPGDAPHDAAGE
jgi:hypothetical protein